MRASNLVYLHTLRRTRVKPSLQFMHDLALSSGSQLSLGPRGLAGVPMLPCLEGVGVMGDVMDEEAGSGLGDRRRSPLLDESAAR